MIARLRQSQTPQKTKSDFKSVITTRQMLKTLCRVVTLFFMLSGLIEGVQSYQYFSLNNTGFPPCDALVSAGLIDRVLLPSSSQYEPRVQTWFSANARLRPWCFVLPHSTQELSTIVKALNAAGGGAGDWHIAVRSGGHAYPGSNNIANGITIDLSMMKSSSYDTNTGFASIQPGARWGDVYRTLIDKYNVTVTGGRDGNVGVGGFLLGGGNSYFSGRNGFGCDTVINHEVVLANGSIISANAHENADIWRALKGGALNFGIVTRFDVKAERAMDLAYGRSFIAAGQADEVMDAIAEFTNHQTKETGADHVFVLFLHDTAASSLDTFLVVRANSLGNLNTTSFDKFNRIPTLQPPSWERKSLADIANSSRSEDGRASSTATLTFLASPSVLRKIAALHTEFVASLSAKVGPNAFGFQAFFQPLPSYYATMNKGHNVLGLDGIRGNAILWSAGVYTAKGKTYDATLAILHTELRVMVSKMKKIAEAEGQDSGWIYLNYASASEDPLRGYGPKNLEFMNEVMRKYDPEGFFQKRVPGGFKLSRVTTDF